MSIIKNGDLLISYPYLEDSFFFRSVVCMIDHNKDGSFGLIINKKMPNKVGEVLPQFANIANNLYVGGPVETQNLFFLHPYKDLKNTIKVTDNLYWNGDLNELSDMFELEFAKSEDVKFFLGYSGWGDAQLMDEIKEQSWLIGEFDLGLIFDRGEDDVIWRKSIQYLGKDFEDMAHFPVDPKMN
jgi:putative transcriptional regulator